MWRIGVDLGGSKIEALALSAEGIECNRRRIATPRGDYEATLGAVVELIHSCHSSLPGSEVASAGIGIPGSISPRTGLVRNANSTWLNGRPFHTDLQAKLDLPITVENDANCFALSEAADGAGAGFSVVFGVILGTGVGGGLVVDGKLLLGKNAIGGEWGHNPLPWPDHAELTGKPCYCGQSGCIETFLCGPALEDQYRARTGKAASAKLIAELAGQGEIEAGACIATYARRLAKSLATVINVVDPGIIVFGGGVSNMASMLARARAELSSRVFSDCCETEFRCNRWGDSSGVRGAARLIPSRNMHPGV